MKKATSRALIIFGLLGLIDSIYLSYAELTDSKLACSISGLTGCNIVAQSQYSWLFGIPLGVYGIGFYLVILALTIGILRWPCRPAFQALFAIGWLGLIASIVFVLIQIFLIKALCVYCLASAVLALFICIAGTMLWRHAPAAKPKAVSIPSM